MIRTFNTLTKIMDYNPTLLYENGKFMFKMEQLSEDTYEAKEWLTHTKIMNGYTIIKKTYYDGDILKYINNGLVEYYYLENKTLKDLRCYIDNNFGANFEMYYYNDGDELSVIDCFKYEIIGNIYEFDFNSFLMDTKLI